MESNATMCPILSTAEENVSCKQGACAWYDGFRCATVAIQGHLNDIVNNTSYIYIQDASDQIEKILEAVESIKGKLGQ